MRLLRLARPGVGAPFLYSRSMASTWGLLSAFNPPRSGRACMDCPCPLAESGALRVSGSGHYAQGCSVVLGTCLGGRWFGWGLTLPGAGDWAGWDHPEGALSTHSPMSPPALSPISVTSGERHLTLTHPGPRVLGESQAKCVSCQTLSCCSGAED